MNTLETIDGMLKLEQAGKGIKEFFVQNDVHDVALYGLGRLGERTYEALRRAGVNIQYAIDRDADYISIEEDKLTVIKPEDIEKQKEIDLIIVTPMESYYDIKDYLETVTSRDIISIGEAVEYCLDGECLSTLRIVRKK
ncbi:hypothetical protein [Butyrivibrio sp. VCD2006]|uniref:hypothetical protein n=1 Tax=Butyrivibrio sp. VCD2006 TaxID=1280664 RepID=UPI0004184DDE|nr:hypothetical protein [Butyrivibrio sp. VCD2006]